LLRGGELGSAKSYGQLVIACDEGKGVEKDEKKARHFEKRAAIGGDVGSRHNLGVFVSGLGHTGSLNNIKLRFLKRGRATRDDYLQALLSYQKYLEEVRSDQRDEAAAFDDDNMYLFEE
jgi:TPR repeat protein